MTEIHRPARRPGEWPVARTPLPEHDTEYEQYIAQRNRIQAERARWHLTLGAIRAHLEEQPSPAAVRAATRRWIAGIAQAAEETTSAMHNQNNKERGQ